ncbi:hypothetical protein ONZ45_g10244 [Pleurotus djamor]|nr:hypothetical protein ONZ45_g10244 [Pleurotus djamor]
MDDLEPLDPSYVESVLSNPPFVVIPGVINVRDLGSYPSTTHPGRATKPNLLFRSAELSAITPEGKDVVKTLGIARVFDLRSDTEIEKYNTPVPQIEGVEVLRAPVFQKEDYSPEMMARRYQLYASGKTEAFMELYSQILDHDNEAIAKDYALTRVGREPARPLIMARLAKEPLFATNSEAALNMFTCRHETMISFLEVLDDKYGGVEQYLKQYVQLTEEDIHQVRENILVPSAVL